MEKKKLNITFLTAYSGIVFRGGETFVHKLANELCILGANVTVIQNGPQLHGALYETISLAINLDNTNIKPESPFFSKHSGFIRRFSITASKSIPKNTDILIPLNGGWQSVISKIWCLIYRKKLVIAGQSGIGFDDIINLFVFPNAFVPLTNEAFQWAKKTNPLLHYYKINNGVDLDDFKNISKKKSRLRNILCVAALDKQKRIDLVIKSVSNIPNVFLKIVGKGPEENYLKKLANDLLPNRHVFLSFPHNKMPSVYSNSDLFVFTPQHSESFGIVYLEAMAANIPVVCIDDPQRREIVGNAGIFVKNPENISLLTKSIEEALSKKWANIPRKQAEKFDWNRIAVSYMDLFYKLYI